MSGPKSTSTSNAAVEELRALVQVGVGHVPGHDTKSQMLGDILVHAPADAQIWDVLGLTLKTCRGARLPPAVAGVPGKALIVELYDLYVAKGTPELPSPSETSPSPPSETSPSPSLPSPSAVKATTDTVPKCLPGHAYCQTCGEKPKASFSKSQLQKKKSRCVSCTFYPVAAGNDDVVPKSVVGEDASKDPRQVLLENWKDLSDLLGQSIAFMFQRFNADESDAPSDNKSSHFLSFMKEAQADDTTESKK
jgi:hypothetical protein